MNRRRKTSPWAWIPTLYIAEGLPYFAVNVMTVVMYTNLGVSKTDMALLTGWLYLPWVIKPIWSPFVDIIRTKRWWTLGMQLLIAVALAGVAFALQLPAYLALTLTFFWLMAFFSATHDIAADGYYMLELTQHDQAAYVGVRSTFYRIASVIGQGGLIYLAGKLEESTHSIPFAWSLTFGLLSAFFFIIWLYHTRFLPKPEADRPNRETTARQIARNFGETFVTFFKKPHIASALAFMLLYRLPEAMCLKIVPPFLLDSVDNGGLGLTTAEVGIANGTVGVIALLAGGIIGGIAIAKWGLKKCLWPMALSLTLPCVLYCVLAILQPQNFTLVCTAIAVEQFGYGFGFTAFMLYLIYFSQGENKTSHYAFCTAFMALGMMIPGMAAGWIYDTLNTVNIFGGNGSPGYINFFWWIMLSCVATFIAVKCIHVAPHFGMKTAESRKFEKKELSIESPKEDEL